MFSRLLIAILLLTIPASNAPAQTREVPDSPAQIQLSFAPVVKKLAPTVVNIYTKRTVTAQAQGPLMNDPFFAPFFQDNVFGGRMRKQVENALGSGVIIEADGLVVTNVHVVKDADEITVVLSDGREFDGKVVLKDDPSDVALLRIDTKGESLPFATLRPSESLEVGDIVLAIGNPFGVGQTVTSGIVSALARSSLNVNDFNFFIQTDAAINPGNSGGPLVALDGGVVGINTAIYSRDGGSLGIGFAIPSEMVATVIAAEKAGGARGDHVVRPWLGVTTQNISSEIARSLGMDRPAGVLVTALHAASPMAKAGIKVGDALISINGHEIHDSAEAKFRMATVPIGQEAEFEIARQGRKQVVKVQAIAPPEIPARAEATLSGNNPLNGATVVNINPAVAVEQGLDAAAKGVVVTGAKSGSYASRMFVPGDIIVEINGVKTNSVAELKTALAGPGANGWELAVNRGGRITQVIIR